MNKRKTTSDLLYDHWMDGTKIAQLPVALQPASEEEGYAVQALLEARSKSALFGWKIAATSAAGQAHIQVAGPLAGRILAERVIEPSGTCPFGSNLMQVAELEFAFRMAETLPPRPKAYSTSEVLACVGSLHPSIEIPDTRLTEFERAGAPQLIADNACANYFMLGRPAPESWRSTNLAEHPVTGSINDGAAHLGIGRNVLGDPRLALTWLANRLSQLGLALAAGQVVTTGTCVIPMPIGHGDKIFGDFGPLGTVTLFIAPR
jgi:2-keto-4-pentenoate hydratase